MKITSKPLVIGISIPKDLSKKSETVSRLLYDHGGLYVLNGTDCIPHITLYMAEFPGVNVHQVKTMMRKIIAHEKALTMKSVKYRQNKFGYVDVSYVRTKDIHKLQSNIVRALNPFRKGLLTQNAKEHLNKVHTVRRNNFIQYGYDYVGENFVPHLTFSRLEKFQKNALSGLPSTDFSFKAHTIAIFEQGKENTCTKVIASFSLLD